MKEARFRSYRLSDKMEALEVFNENCPKYFAEDERMYFENFLDRYNQNYYVISIADKIVALGGYYISMDGKEAELAWGMVCPSHQKHGYGRMLVEYRMERIKQIKKVKKVVVETSQDSSAFYQKMGFELTRTEADYWREGLDLHYLEYTLNSK